MNSGHGTLYSAFLSHHYVGYIFMCENLTMLQGLAEIPDDFVTQL